MLQIDLIKDLPSIVKAWIHDRWMRWLDIREIRRADFLETFFQARDKFVAKTWFRLVLLFKNVEMEFDVCHVCIEVSLENTN